MIVNKKFAFLVILLYCIIFLRDVPYINTWIIDKVWILYLVCFYGGLMLFKKTKTIYMLFFFLVVALIATLLDLSLGAEIVGIGIYFLLWATVFLKIKSHVTSKE